MLADHAARGAVRFHHVQHGLSTGTSVQRRQNRTPLAYCSLRLRLTSGFLGTVFVGRCKCPAKVRSTSLGIWHWQPEPAFQVGPGRPRGPGVADWKLLLVVPGQVPRFKPGGSTFRQCLNRNRDSRITARYGRSSGFRIMMRDPDTEGRRPPQVTIHASASSPAAGTCG
jgi:hypothetical protein